MTFGVILLTKIFETLFCGWWSSVGWLTNPPARHPLCQMVLYMNMRRASFVVLLCKPLCRKCQLYHVTLITYVVLQESSREHTELCHLVLINSGKHEETSPPILCMLEIKRASNKTQRSTCSHCAVQVYAINSHTRSVFCALT